MPEENGLRELRVKEEFDGYFAFQTAGDNTCILVINDWVASSYIGRETIMLPLPNSFTYVESELSGENTVYDADSFIDLLVKEGTDRLTRYNTVIGFSDGMPAYILHADYPEGPDPNSEPGWAGE